MPGKNGFLTNEEMENMHPYDRCKLCACYLVKGVEDECSNGYQCSKKGVCPIFSPKKKKGKDANNLEGWDKIIKTMKK